MNIIKYISYTISLTIVSLESSFTKHHHLPSSSSTPCNLSLSASVAAHMPRTFCSSRSVEARCWRVIWSSHSHSYNSLLSPCMPFSKSFILVLSSATSPWRTLACSRSSVSWASFSIIYLPTPSSSRTSPF